MRVFPRAVAVDRRYYKPKTGVQMTGIVPAKPMS